MKTLFEIALPKKQFKKLKTSVQQKLNQNLNAVNALKRVKHLKVLKQQLSQIYCIKQPMSQNAEVMVLIRIQHIIGCTTLHHWQPRIESQVKNLLNLYDQDGDTLLNIAIEADIPMLKVLLIS